MGKVSGNDYNTDIDGMDNTNIIDILNKIINKGTVIEKIFKSRKNIVAMISTDDGLTVLKLYNTGSKSMMRELKILNSSLSINVPKVNIVDKKRRFIIMEYIDGKNLCDLVNDYNVEYSTKLRALISLAGWINSFHRCFRRRNGFIIRGDSILRNFIFTGSKIYGVDFEESRIGRVEEDISMICASLLTSSPMFTYDKMKLCKSFLGEYKLKANWSIDNFEMELLNSLETIAKRRRKENTIKQ